MLRMGDFARDSTCALCLLLPFGACDWHALGAGDHDADLESPGVAQPSGELDVIGRCLPLDLRSRG